MHFYQVQNMRDCLETSNIIGLQLGLEGQMSEIVQTTDQDHDSHGLEAF